MSRWQAAIAAGLVALALGSNSAWPLDDAEVTANGCATAVGRDVTNSAITVTCNYGLSPEQVKELTEAAAKGATGPLTATIVDLSKQLGVTEDATKTLLRIVGEQDVPLERLSETLAKVANDYKRLQAQAAALSPDNPTARGLVEQARAEIKAGHFPRAHELLREATQAQIAAAQQARQLREQAQAAEEAQLIGAAASTAVAGDLAVTERDYLQAAELFAQAASLVPPSQEQLQAGYREREADALYRQGDERADNSALVQAIAIYRDLVEMRLREQAQREWARTQNRLGLALMRLYEGTIEDDSTVLLDEAISIFSSASSDSVRELDQLLWADIKLNYGLALDWNGEWNVSVDQLENAVTALRQALEERTYDQDPQGWAYIQFNIGVALEKIGTLTGDPAQVEEGIDALNQSLKVRTRERDPLGWAQSQDGLADALLILGILNELERTPVEHAIQAYTSALEIWTRNLSPSKWATTQRKLGFAFIDLGELELKEKRLDQAMAAFATARTHLKTIASPEEVEERIRLQMSRAVD